MSDKRDTFWRRLSKAAKDPDNSEWLEKQQRSARRQRLVILSAGIIVFALLAGSFGYWYTHRLSKVGAGSSSSGTAQKDTGNKGVNNTEPSNTTVVLDPRLIHSFHGIGYTPLESQMPWCGASLANVTEDIKVLSQLTPRIRLYGQDCQQADLVLQAIRLLKVKMNVILTVWVDANDTTYQRQYNSVLETLKNYGGDRNIEAISVGNEVLFRKEVKPEVLFQRMNNLRLALKQMNLAYIKVVTSDLGSNVSPAMVKATDAVLANVHPFFAGVVVDKASDWTFTFFNDNCVKPAAQKPAILSEVGWPTANGTEKGAVASVPNLQTFIDTFLCEANKRKLEYYFFEAFDEPWKIITGSEMETHWGIMTVDRVLKIKIPNCPVPKLT